MDLKTFLLARIEEDEAVAREEDDDYADTTLLPTYDSEHQANWNTARVLAECAAKRAIIEHWGPYETLEGPDLLRTLAAVYADHHDYQPEWAQEGAK